MALLWIEGFEGFGAAGADPGLAINPADCVSRKYPVVSDISYFKIVTGRVNGRAIRCGSMYNVLGPGNLTTDATLIVGCGMKWTGTGFGSFLEFYDGATLGVNLKVTSGGEIAIYRGGTLLETSSGAGLIANTWYYIEAKVVCGASGSYEVRVNGVNILSATGVNTKAGTHDYHTTFHLRAALNFNAYFDDVYCLDGSATAPNDFLGNVQAVAAIPNAAGDSSQFTPSAGANYECVDDGAASGDDTDYVESATAGHTDLYNYASLAGAGSTIHGVQVNTECRKTAAASMSLKTVVKSGGSEYEDSAQPVGDSYQTVSRVFPKNPVSDAAWTVSAIDAAQFGVKVS
jgi:hypothetical protein